MGETMNRYLMVVGVMLASTQAASAADPAIERSLNAAGCSPFMTRQAVTGSWALNSTAYGKTVGAWTTEDFQFLLNFGTRCYQQELSESIAAREAEVLRGQINDRINGIVQQRRNQDALRDTERRLSSAKADDYAIEPDEAGATQTAAVEQDSGRIAQIENDFRDRYRSEVDNPQTTVARLNAILQELDEVKAGLAYSPRLTSFRDRIRFQIQTAQRRAQNRPLSQEERNLLARGGFFGSCHILGVQTNNAALQNAAIEEMRSVAGDLAARIPQETETRLVNAFSKNAALAYPKNRAGVQKLYDACADDLDF